MDWKDIAIHAFAGAAIGLVSVFIIGWPLVVANAAFWICREVLQRFQKEQPLSHMFSPQVLLEWAVPSVLCFAVAVAL